MAKTPGKTAFPVGAKSRISAQDATAAMMARAEADGRCVSCWQVRRTAPVPVFAETIFASLCAGCQQRMALAKLHRQHRAAEIHARLLGLALNGMTADGLADAAKAGEDLFGVCALNAGEYSAFLHAAEDAVDFYPAGHPLRALIAAVRPTCHRVRPRCQRRQARCAAFTPAKETFYIR